MTDEELYAQARKRFDRSAAYDSEDRKNAENDLSFLGGEQWDVGDLGARKALAKPSLTINQLPKFIRQITNEARLNEVSIKLRPVDDLGDPEIAEVMEGMCRTIEAESEAETVYDTALEHAAECGRGAFRFLTEYESDDSFNQVIRMDVIDDPLAVYWDPKAKRYDKSDAKWCFVVEWMSKEEFKEKYKREPSDFDSGGSTVWYDDDGVRIAEYWYVEDGKPYTLYLLQSGDIIDTRNDPRDVETFAAEGRPVVSRRQVRERKVFRRLMDGGGFIAKPEEFPCKYIPVVPVTGPKLTVKGKVQYWSGVRWAKTPQALYNLWISTLSEKAKLAPRSPYLMTPTMVEGHENDWRDANIKNQAYLLYNPDPKAPGAAPQRNEPAYVNQAELGLLTIARQDLQDTTGIYKTSLGDQGNEISGVAIAGRQSESDIGTLDWIDNLHRSIRHGGRILVDMIPRVYDTERVVGIIGADETHDWVRINQVTGRDTNGQQVVSNDLTVGRYDVRIETGPTFKTQREEASSNMITLLGAVPQFASAFLGLALKNMDFKDADEAAKRVDIMTGWKQPEPDDQVPQQGPDIQQQKDQLDVEGKQLVNMQRKLDLADEVGKRQQVIDQINQMQKGLTQ